ncbi:MAG: TetR/AcrR family transcriptional regulator [Proteobacteria bacterium]|nr:TetR/AcrR family transcriptional regulator [Pseudomonadota bacterium]
MAKRRRRRAAWRADPGTESWERVRDRILDATATCVERVGSARLRMEQVAREAGCSRATLYRYFADKEDLLVAQAVRRAGRLSERALAGLDPHLDPRDRIVEGIVDTIAALRADPRERGAGPQDRADSDRLVTGSATIHAAVAKMLEPHLEEAREMGVLRSDVSTAEAAEWLILVSLALVNSAWPEGPGATRTRDEQIAYLRRFLLPSIFTC